MVRSLFRSARRAIARKLYTPPKWDREQKLSMSGVFDFAFDNPTKREIVESVGTSTVGGRKHYSEGQFASISGACWDAMYRRYMDNYLDESDDKSVREMNALQRFVQYETIPELVECKVLEARVEIGDDEHVVVSDVDGLLENNVLEAYKQKYKSSGEFVGNLDSDSKITGIRPGERFDFAYQCLEQVSEVNSKSRFAEGRI